MCSWRLVLPLVAAVGCAAPPPDHGDDDSSDQAAPDSWGPTLSLRDPVSDPPAAAERGVTRPDGGWFVTPIHATLLADGKLLVTGWGRADRNRCRVEGKRLYGVTFVLDPAKLTTGGELAIEPLDEQPAPSTPRDVLYCAGHTPLADGGVLFAGGARYTGFGTPQEQETGLDYARIYDPVAHSFHRVDAPMKGGPRWYPTLTRLPDGRVLVTGGYRDCCPTPILNLSVELFDPAAERAGADPWTLLVPHDDANVDLAASIRGYPHVFTLPQPVVRDGRSFDTVIVGDSGAVQLFGHDGSEGSGELLPLTRRPEMAAASDGTAAVLATGEILVVGGTGGPSGHPFSEPASRRADLYDPAADSWRSIDLVIRRFTPASTLLPDGTVLIVNGEGAEADGDRTPQLLDPRGPLAVGKLAPFPTPDGTVVAEPGKRGYHNLSLLLPDGRVLIGGGSNAADSIGCERTDLQIYTPPYLGAAPRPQIVRDPAGPIALEIGGPPVALGDPGQPLAEHGGAVLAATGSFTHGFDFSQRIVPLELTSSPDGIEIHPPATGSAAPPGDYFLFLVSADGVPSIGAPVHLD